VPAGFGHTTTTKENTNMADTKIRENRLRQVADRQGLRLEKSHARNENDITYGTYQLVTHQYGGTVHADCTAGRGYGLDLDDVEEYLSGDPIDIAGEENVMDMERIRELHNAGQSDDAIAQEVGWTVNDVRRLVGIIEEDD
jgi:hypothetical protein